MEKDKIQIFVDSDPTKYLETNDCDGNVYALAGADCPASCPQRRYKTIRSRRASSTPVTRDVYVCAAFSREADYKDSSDLRAARLQTMHEYVAKRIRNGHSTPLPHCCGYRAKIT